MPQKTKKTTLKSSIVSTAGIVSRHRKSPDELFGELFSDMQKTQLYPDGKTVADLIPKKRIASIQEEYRISKQDPDFDLREFVARHFYEVSPSQRHQKAPDLDPHDTTLQHIARLWPQLERSNHIDRGSLLALPHHYTVPGGRFNEQFYWDSYFIMLGLAAEDQWNEVEAMVKNFSFMIRKYGYIPTANRSYLLSRSQPPFFVMMVKLLASHKGKKVLRTYLPAMVDEYRFWMRGRKKLAQTEHHAYRRVAQMPNGKLLNRYYDNKTTPRPESLREDTETAEGSMKRQADRLYLHLRAGAESGWDFSSRWFRDNRTIESIHTADIIPVDLNSLLYLLEETIAEAYSSVRHPLIVRRYKNAAAHRKESMNDYLWDEKAAFYKDYNFHHRETTDTYSLAAVFPLYAGIASKEQAMKVARRIERDFLKHGGVVTTLEETGQQWDSPNGWAPLQWVTIEGLRRYGFDVLANTISERWLTVNDEVFAHSHKLYEKYNVVTGGKGGGGEYQLQDGFGWTNGVYSALKRGFTLDH